jgi:type II secretory pathway predicted ATPase ExeA
MTPSSAVVLAHWGLALNPYDIAGTTGNTITVTDSMRATQEFMLTQAGLGGCSGVLGDIGDGKTTALKHAKRAMLKQPDRFVVVHPVTLATGSLTTPSLVRFIYETHGSYVPRFATSASKLTALLSLVENIPARTVVLLDEAHLLHASVIRLAKELADATPQIATILVGHRLPMSSRLRKSDSQDLAKRLEVGRTFVPPPLGLTDAKRILEQRRGLTLNAPAIPDEVTKEMLAHHANPLGLLSMAWAILEHGAMTGNREVTTKSLRAAMSRRTGMP